MWDLQLFEGLVDMSNESFEDLYHFFIVFLSLKEDSIYGYKYPNQRQMWNTLYLGDRSLRLNPHHWLFFRFAETDSRFINQLATKSYFQRRLEAMAHEDKSYKFEDVLVDFFW